ncbi:hypothetical protein PCANC_13773 [Puccinia coronata f. sp. avenae]|uniref:Uncharacterized protein n=1 Tax=Puccinia coronata f. sp. avenae TaxID=200324 RepID=A0A2N5SWJ0_9BASI|nr:hypothetical protein PCANC_13773 [Puccinia coronata f. sp. avenae]PLW47039.1 hypothetical protein PCASD_03919 [Puccinia coronata f. sp. avenae]
MNKERTSQSQTHHQRALNRSQLKALTDNLRLRLKYAKLKVINGWHNQTLNEIESTFYYLKLPKPQPPKQQAGKQVTLPKQASLDHSSSPSTSTTISASSYTLSKGSIHPHAIESSYLHPVSTFKLPNIPASTIPKLTENSSVRPHPHQQQHKENDEQHTIQTSAFISNSTHTTTLSLPAKYSTPFRKIIRPDGSAVRQLMTNESNIFWPAGPMTSPSSNVSPSSSSKMRGSYTRKNRRTPEGLLFKVGSGTAERMNQPQSKRNLPENEDLFKDPVEDYRELYKQSSPASFLFSNHYHRPPLGSSSKPTPTRTLFNHPLDLLSSISPVRIRSHLHSDPHRPPPQALVRLAASSLVSPSPNRTQSHLSKIFGAGTADLPGPSLADDDDGDDLENPAEEDDKENLVDPSTTKPSSTSPPKSHPARSWPIRFSLEPRPPRSTSHRPTASASPQLDQEVESTTGVHEIGLDELDQMNWE